jgi:pyruvate kinase
MVNDANSFLRRTKIVATLGPSTDSPAVMEDMMRAGLDVARINFSHGGKEEQRRRIQAIRAAADKVGRPVGILADLSGPKIRIESFANGPIMLAEGQPFALDIALDADAGNEREVGCAYKDLVKDVKPGDTLLLADGYIVLEVVSVSATRVECVTRAGGDWPRRCAWTSWPFRSRAMPPTSGARRPNCASGRAPRTWWPRSSATRPSTTCRTSSPRPMR